MIVARIFNELWFEALGKMDSAQVEQVAVSGKNELPNSQEVVEGFPSLWVQMYENEGQIAITMSN